MGGWKYEVDGDGVVMKVEEVLAAMDKMKIIEVSTVSDPSRVGCTSLGR